MFETRKGTISRTPEKKMRRRKGLRSKNQKNEEAADREVNEEEGTSEFIEKEELQGAHDKACIDEVPKEDEVEKPKKKKNKHEEEDHVDVPKNFTLEMISQTLNELRIVRERDPPLIPLCRIQVNQAVRIVTKGAKAMRETLRNDGYILEKGNFILSITDSLGNTIPVTEQIVQSWDDSWKQENEAFESSLQSNDEWNDLSNKMFICWDGNHRTDAWLHEIKERYSLVRNMHFSVKASFVKIEPTKEAALVRAMNRINELNEHGIVKTKLKDILYGVHRLTNSDLTNFLANVSHQELAESRNAEVKAMKKESWYPHTRYILAKMMYQSTIVKEIDALTEKYSEGLGNDEAKVRAEKEVRRKWQTKMGKYLAIVNPDLGHNWVNMVTSRQLENNYIRLTLEKLHDMTKARVDPCVRDKWLEWMVSGTAIVSSYKIPNNDKEFNDWLKKETWLEHLLKKSQETFDSVISAKQILVANVGDTLEVWFDDFKLKYRDSMFKTFEKNMSLTTKVEDAYDIKRSSMRVCFRYFVYCVSKQYVDKVPVLVRRWATLDEVSTMYNQKDKKSVMSKWEIDNCPWWVDFPHGEVPEEELEQYNALCSESKAQDEEGQFSFDNRKRKNVGKIEAKSAKKQCPSASIREEEEVLEIFDDVDARPLYDFKNINSLLVCLDVHVLAKSIVSPASSMDFKDFKRLREFARSNKMTNKILQRNGKPRDWGFHMVLIDLPTNIIPTIGHNEIPAWNSCDQELIDDSLSIATLCLDDKGFALCICMQEQLKTLDMYAKKRNLEKCRMFYISSKVPFGHSKDKLGMIAHYCQVCVIYSRIGVSMPPTNNMPFQHKVYGPDRDFYTHYLTETDRLHYKDMQLSRFGLERSPMFMEFILHTYCPVGGLVLDLFAGSAPMIFAAAMRGVHYYGIERDYALVQEVIALRKYTAKISEEEKSNYEDEDEDDENLDRIQVQDILEPDD